MATVASLIELVQPFVRDCPDDVISKWLIEAARDLCAETKVVRETIVFDSVAGQPVYHLVPVMAETEVVAVKAAQYLDTVLEPASFEEVPPGQSGDPYAFMFYEPDEFWVADIPNTVTANAFSVSAWLQPTLACVNLPDALTRKHRQVVADGAMAKLFMQTDATWGDIKRAATHAEFYKEGLELLRYKEDRALRARRFRTIPAWSNP